MGIVDAKIERVIKNDGTEIGAKTAAVVQKV
jgi:hypothetical protein